MNQSSERRQHDPLDSSVEKPSSMPTEDQPNEADAPNLGAQVGESNAEVELKLFP